MDELKAWINAKDYTVAIMETMVKGGAGAVQWFTVWRFQPYKNAI